MHMRMRSTTSSVYLDLRRGVMSKTNAIPKKIAVGKRATPSTYNYNVVLVNCEQDWKASGHCSICVVSSRNKYSIMIVRHIVYSIN